MPLRAVAPEFLQNFRVLDAKAGDRPLPGTENPSMGKPPSPKPTGRATIGTGS